MSSLTASSPAIRRPGAVLVALILLALISLFGLIPVPPDSGVPLAVIIIKPVLGVVGLIAVFGLWRCRRWAAILAGAVTVLNVLSSAPGLLSEAPAGIIVAIELVFHVATLVALALPSARRAYV